MKAPPVTARHDKATVDQAIADVERGLDNLVIRGIHGSNEGRVNEVRAALRVLADAVEEAQHERAVAIEAAMQYRKERDRLQAALDNGDRLLSQAGRIEENLKAMLASAANERDDNDEEIARLEGALDQAHKDYDEMKAEAQTLRDALEQAQRVTTLISDDGPPFLLDGEPLTGAAEVELLSLHDLVSHALATPDTPPCPRGRRGNMTPEQKRIRSLEQTVRTLAAWLVQAQTGFGVQDMRGIEGDIERSRNAAPFPDEETKP